MAHSSASSGSIEVWVTASNGSGQPRRLTDLGGQAHGDSWSPDGRTLSLHHHGKSGAVNILLPRVDGVEQKPQVLLEREIAVSARFSRDGHDVSADGQRLLMLTDAATTPSRIVVVQNWTEEIKRLVPVR